MKISGDWSWIMILNIPLVKSWLTQHVPNQIPWPSQSSDLNPIENLFGWVKQELIKLGPRTIPELKQKLEET